MIARIINLSFDTEGNSQLLLRTKTNLKSLYEELSGVDVEVTIKKSHPKRSKNANAYFWELCGQLAAKLQIPKTDIYRHYIKEIGDNYTIGCFRTKDIENVKRDWENNGVGWIVETLDSKLDDCTNVMLYRGSSVYDTAQMSRLIDLCVQDCKENNIETLPPDELNSLLKEWNNEE